MKMVVIPEMTTIHIPIITICLKIISNIYLLIIFIPDVLHKIYILHVIQWILNTTETIIETICKVMQCEAISKVMQCVIQFDSEWFSYLYNFFEGLRGNSHCKQHIKSTKRNLLKWFIQWHWFGRNLSTLWKVMNSAVLFPSRENPKQ